MVCKMLLSCLIDLRNIITSIANIWVFHTSFFCLVIFLLGLCMAIDFIEFLIMLIDWNLHSRCLWKFQYCWQASCFTQDDCLHLYLSLGWPLRWWIHENLHRLFTFGVSRHHFLEGFLRYQAWHHSEYHTSFLILKVFLFVSQEVRGSQKNLLWLLLDLNQREERFGCLVPSCCITLSWSWVVLLSCEFVDPLLFEYFCPKIQDQHLIHWL